MYLKTQANSGSEIIRSRIIEVVQAMCPEKLELVKTNIPSASRVARRIEDICQYTLGTH
jgi:hypothetical protein